MPMRWRWPPENSWGKRLACSRLRPTIFQQLVDALLAALLVVHFMDDHALLDDGGNRHAGVQRGVGVLEDDLGLFGVGKAVFGVLQVHLFALVRELAKSGRVDAHGHTAQGGLAAAGLAHQAHGLALVDVKGDVVHGLFRGSPPETLKYLQMSSRERSTSLDLVDNFLSPSFRAGTVEDGAASRRPHGPRPR